MDGTECVSCDSNTPQFRVVIDLDTERRIGVICEPCLKEEFGDTILSPDWRNQDGCAICDRDDFYGLPPVNLTRETRGVDQICSRYEYSLEDDVLGLCDEHLSWLTAEEIPQQPVVADGGFRRR